MKKLLTIVLCLALSSAVFADPNEPTKEKYITAWLNVGNFDAGQTDLGLWIGYRQPANENFDIEAGLAGNYHQWDVDDGYEYSMAAGGYAVLHTKGLIDVNMPVQFEGFPVKLIGEPFVSFEYLKNINDEGQSFGIGTGARLFDLLAFKVQYNIIEGVPVNDHIVLSLSFRFKF